MPDMCDKKQQDKPDFDQSADEPTDDNDVQPAEYGGPRGREPTRYGDWEKNGRCIDF